MTDTATTDRPASDTLPPARWAVVEIMGHRKHAGRVEEVSQFGAAMLRVSIFTDGDTAIATHDYGGGSIFAITDCTEEFARNMERRWRQYDGQRTPLALPSTTVDDDDEPDFREVG